MSLMFPLAQSCNRFCAINLYRITSTCLFSLLMLLCAVSPSDSQLLKPHGYDLLQPESMLRSNFTTDIVIAGGGIWFGTGRGLGYSADEGESFVNFFRTPGIGRGGTSAILVQDGVIWTAAAYDTTTSSGNLDAGGGLSWSDDLGQTWHYIPQPVDPNNEDSLGYKPTTTNILNLTYDIAMHKGTVWIANFGGGLRRSDDSGETWQVVTPDGFPFAPLEYLNHRPFAVVSDGVTLWVGTAQGVNKSTDDGETWTNYTALNSGISGNFIPALAIQQATGGPVIWAASWQAEGETERYGVSRSTNGGLTWESYLDGERAHNFGFNGDDVYVVSDNGLFKSPDLGKSWYEFPWIRTSSGESVYTTEYYSVACGGGLLWLGTGDGLVRSADGGMTWDILRSFREPGTDGEPAVYAYPNPFSPARHNRLGGEGHVRIQYALDAPATVFFDVFDFGMNPVFTSSRNSRNTGPNAEVWDGRNTWGRIVANGTYFYRLTIDGAGEFWGKIIVMN